MAMYLLTLADPKHRFYRIIYWLLVTLNIAAMVLVTIYADRNFGRIAIGLFLVDLVSSRWMRSPVAGFSLGYHLFLSGGLWLVGGFLVAKFFYLLGFIFLALGTLFVLSIRKKIVKISSERVVFPSLTRRVLEWNEISNLVLKDGLLTIDLKNNRLIQEKVDGSFPIDEQEFNEFCRRQLIQ